MADESALNTFTLSVDLPVFPDIFFKVVFNCNGYTLISDEFNNGNDALAWAEDQLGDFGEWSLSGNTLGLFESLCGVGSLTTIASSESSEDSGLVLALDNSSPQAITDIYGLVAVDSSVNSEKGNDTDWQNKVELLSGLFIEPIAGSTSQWALYKAVGSDGYNIVLSEVTDRGEDIDTLLDGVGAVTYGYGFFEDALAYIQDLSPEPQIVITLNLIRPVLNGTYTPTETEIDYCVSACAAAGVTIRCFQLCYELGLSSNDDVFTSASAISTATQTVATYIRTNYPTIKISADANNWDDTHLNWPTLNSLINAVTSIDYVREYFQFDLPTYAANRERITELPQMLNEFRDEFTNGQELRLAQSTFKTTNPLRNKVGEGLIYSEFLIEIIKENINSDGLIVDFAHYNLSRLVSGTGDLFAAYDFMVLMRGAMSNDGKIDYELDNEDLIILPVKSGLVAEVYIVNPTSDFVEIDSVTLNGVEKSVTVESYYGSPTTTDSSHFTDSGEAILLYPHSLTKVVTT